MLYLSAYSAAGEQDQKPASMTLRSIAHHVIYSAACLCTYTSIFAKHGLGEVGDVQRWAACHLSAANTTHHCQKTWAKEDSLQEASNAPSRHAPAEARAEVPSRPKAREPRLWPSSAKPSASGSLGSPGFSEIL